MKHTVKLILAVTLSTSIWAADVKVKMADLPPAVQTAVKEQTKSATLVSLVKETENGKTTWEAETTLNGKGRDVSFDKTGAVVSVEQEIDLDALPAAARTAITKKIGTGKLTKVESVTVGTTVSFEATYTKAGKTLEAGVNADGTPHK